jgi:DNA-binding CsgD family transcriptional regulator
MSVQDKIDKLSRIRWACRGVIAFATGVSIWGNYLSAHPNDWISRVAEVLPPLFLFGLLELMTRIPIPPGYRWYHYKRWGRPVALVALAGGSILLSYINQYHAFAPHTSQLSATMLPGIIDATMIVALISLIELNDQVRVLDAMVTADALTESKKADPNAAPRRRSKTKTEKIVKLLGTHPELPDAEVAKRAGASVSLVYATRRDLKAKQALVA